MSDLISRQEAIEAIDAVFQVDPMKSVHAQGIALGAALAKTYIERLPSAQPERKTGRWYKPQGYPRDSYRFICDNCHDVAYFVTGNNGKKNKSDNPKCGYCYYPNCGARMEGNT